MKTTASRVVGTLAIQSAPQAAAQALREAIIAGELKGGDRILEHKWSAQLSVGQPTLREALRELEQQGLLKKLPQRGTYVVQLSLDDYRRILEVRIPLESIAIGRAAVRLTNEGERELTDLVMAMTATGKEMDVRRFHDYDVLFHRRIWEIADNEYLRETLEKLTFRLFVFSLAGRWPDIPGALSERLAAMQQHVAILEGLCSRNAGKARTAFVQQTIHYWNTQYGLELDGEDIVGSSAVRL
ncbi:GntR family transcriptional regulator [Silvibacterium acidisoli]|uniref:GntR family transcriptional regulator n=1 Tax=Acidobacteriaceae bacterium ZG23-2 TaxID=2883246 RepID=UPI00406BFD6A